MRPVCLLFVLHILTLTSGSAASELACHQLWTSSPLEAWVKPSKSASPVDLKQAGVVIDLHQGGQDVAREFCSREGVYLYLVDTQDRLILSHRAPMLSGLDPRLQPHLATHRALFRTLQKQSPAGIWVGGEYRVINQEVVSFSGKAGSFHDRLSVLLCKLLPQLRQEQRPLARSLIADLKVAEMLTDKVEKNRAYLAILKDPQKSRLVIEIKEQGAALARRRLDIGEWVLRRVGLLSPQSERKELDLLADDGHVEAQRSAFFEIQCAQDPKCSQHLAVLRSGYNTLASSFTPEQLIRNMSRLLGEYNANNPDLADDFFKLYFFLGRVQADGVADTLSVLSQKGEPGEMEMILEKFPRLTELLIQGEGDGKSQGQKINDRLAAGSRQAR